MKFLIIGIFTLFTFKVYSQKETSYSNERAKYEAKRNIEATTLTFNLGGLSKNEQGKIKDDILNYKGKIISLILDEKSKVMTVTFLSILSKEKIYNILSYHGYKNNLIESNDLAN